MRRSLIAGLSFVLIVHCAANAQAPQTVDFARDVQPILRQKCVSCHGATKQNGGLRLDRRSSATKALSRRIVPGNSANSLLYHRLVVRCRHQLGGDGGCGEPAG